MFYSEGKRLKYFHLNYTENFSKSKTQIDFPKGILLKLRSNNYLRNLQNSENTTFFMDLSGQPNTDISFFKLPINTCSSRGADMAFIWSHVSGYLTKAKTLFFTDCVLSS